MFMKIIGQNINIVIQFSQMATDDHDIRFIIRADIVCRGLDKSFCVRQSLLSFIKLRVIMQAFNVFLTAGYVSCILLVTNVMDH